MKILPFSIVFGLSLIVLWPYSTVNAEGFNATCGTTDCTVFKIDLEVDQLKLIDRDEEGILFGNFSAVETWAEKSGKKLIFATNAGIFSKAIVPLGLFIKDNREIVPVNKESGAGNFYMKPNGIFYIEKGRANIVETSKYILNHTVELATQSGPLLLLNGVINSSFKNGSENRLIRSAVGVKNSKELFFVISNGAINFWDFSKFFKDQLNCTDALYLDGTISKMFVPELKRFEKGGEFAAIFFLLEDGNIP